MQVRKWMKNNLSRVSWLPTCPTSYTTPWVDSTWMNFANMLDSFHGSSWNILVSLFHIFPDYPHLLGSISVYGQMWSKAPGPNRWSNRVRIDHLIGGLEVGSVRSIRSIRRGLDCVTGRWSPDVSVVDRGRSGWTYHPKSKLTVSKTKATNPDRDILGRSTGTQTHKTSREHSIASNSSPIDPQWPPKVMISHHHPMRSWRSNLIQIQRMTWSPFPSRISNVTWWSITVIPSKVWRMIRLQRGKPNHRNHPSLPHRCLVRLVAVVTARIITLIVLLLVGRSVESWLNLDTVLVWTRSMNPSVRRSWETWLRSDQKWS